MEPKLFRSSCLLFVLFVAPALANGQNYSIRDLGQGFYPEAVNDLAQVAGWRTLGFSDRAFLVSWGANIEIPLIGGYRNYAYGINNRGEVVGISDSGVVNPQAFIYRRGIATMLPLGTIYSKAVDINDRGEIVGQLFAPHPGTTGMFRAFLYSDGVTTVIPYLGEGQNDATGINASGAVVGYSSLGGVSSPHAFLYQNGLLTDLGALGTGQASRANEINDAGQIVGWSHITFQSVTPYHAFLYECGAMQDLGSIGADRSEALSVNNLGQVVGRAEGFSIGTHAFVYENGHVVDLNSIIPDLRGWELLSATDINNHGQIVGLGRHDGNLHGYLLLPERSVAELIEHLIEVTGTFAEDEPSVSGLIAKLSTARDSFARDSSKAGCNQIRAYVHLLDSRNRPILAPHIDYFVETAREITQRAACP